MILLQKDSSDPVVCQAFRISYDLLMEKNHFPSGYPIYVFVPNQWYVWKMAGTGSGGYGSGKRFDLVF